MDLKLTTVYTLAFLTSTLIFIFCLAGSANDEWLSTTNGTSEKTFGLWKNMEIGKYPEFEGIEIVRGVSTVGVVLCFILWVMSGWMMFHTSKQAKESARQGDDGVEYKFYDLSSGIVFCSGVVCFYTFVTAVVVSSISGRENGVEGMVITALASNSLFWAGFVFSFLLTIFLWYSNVTNQTEESKKKRVDVSENDQNQIRGNWDHHNEYLLSMIGYAVGLGNVWRFPYLCYDNGGGAFLIPYVIMLFLVGLPVFFLECAVGQFDSRGPIVSWNVSPAFRGIGVMMVLYSAYVGVYYNVIIAYSVYYFFASLDSTLPWIDCDNYWNSDFCGSKVASYDNITLASVLTKNNIAFNATNITSVAHSLKISAAEEYYYKHILNKVEDMDGEGAHDIVWQIVVVLLVAWTVVFFSLIRGIKSSGKVVWFTAIFPYVIIFILFIRGLTLEGMEKGIAYYIGKNSDFEALKNPKAWRLAATQIFFSLSAGWGGVQALSSYNNFENNCFRDSLIVAFTNCATSIFAGFAIFSILGHMAHVMDVEVTEVVKSSFGLAFIAYPTALSTLPGSSFWACCFFLMLFTLGLDSQFTILETVATALSDIGPFFRNRRTSMMLGLSIIMFLLGLVCCTRTGINWVDLIDGYVGGWALLFSTLLELIALGTVYGGGVVAWYRGEDEYLIEDIEMMIGKKSKWFWIYWRVCWYIVSPLVMLVLLIWSVVAYTDNSVEWAAAVGWLLVISGLFFLPYYMLKETCILEKLPLTNIFRANKYWGPYPKEYHVGRYADKVNEDDGYVDEEKCEVNENLSRKSSRNCSKSGSKHSGSKMSMHEVVHENANISLDNGDTMEVLVENQSIKPLPIESIDSVIDGLNDEDIQIVQEVQITQERMVGEGTKME